MKLFKLSNFNQQVADLYFKHFLKYKNEFQSVSDFLNDVFGVRYRSIESYRAKEEFQLPGLFLAAPHVAVQGIKRPTRQIRKDDIVWIRNDLREKNVWHVQIIRASDDCFLLNDQEIEKVLRKVELVHIK